MAKKVNGIKVYGRYSLRVILSSIFTIVASIGFLALMFFPISQYTKGDVTYALNAFDYVAYTLNEYFGIDVGVVDSIGNVSHIFLKDGVVSGGSQYFGDLATLTSSNVLISWFPGLAEYINIAISASFLLLVVFGIFLLLKGFIHLIVGTYPKGTKGLTSLSFFVMIIFVLATFVSNFCYKHLMLDNFNDVTFVNCVIPFIVWGVYLVVWFIQSWIKKSLIKGNLYISNAAKIKKDKKNAN